MNLLGMWRKDGFQEMGIEKSLWQTEKSNQTSSIPGLEIELDMQESAIDSLKRGKTKSHPIQIQLQSFGRAQAILYLLYFQSRLIG